MWWILSLPGTRSSPWNGIIWLFLIEKRRMELMLLCSAAAGDIKKPASQRRQAFC